MEEIKVVINSNKTEALKVGDVTYRSFCDFRVTEDDLKQARLELGETEEKIAKSLLKLKDALIKDKDFHYRLEDDYLLRYLRYRKYDVQKAYTTLRNFYEFRKERPDIFDIPSSLEDFLKRGGVKCLPFRDEDGRIICWIDTHKWKLNEMSCIDVLTTEHAVADVISMNPSMQINGIITLGDLGGLTAHHVAYLVQPSVLRMFLKSLQSIYPWRIKKIIGINCNSFLRGVYYAFRYLLSKKIADRVILLGSDMNELHKYISPRILPKEYGGCIESSECNIGEYIKDNLPYIKYERSFGPSKKA